MSNIGSDSKIKGLGRGEDAVRVSAHTVFCNVYNLAKPKD